MLHGPVALSAPPSLQQLCATLTLPLSPHSLLAPLTRLTCHAGANSRPDPLDCDGGYPCSACRTLGARCAYPRATTPPSAWTTIDNAAVQRWPESTQLVPGQAVAFRLTAERDAQGRVEAFGREWMVANDEGTPARLSVH